MWKCLAGEELWGWPTVKLKCGLSGPPAGFAGRLPTRLGYDVGGFRPPKPAPVWCPNCALKEMSPMKPKQNLFSAKFVMTLIAILLLAGSVLAAGQETVI